jgi:divalent metal cation (Fe/Co/Zn/Cd) transporter
MCGASLLSLTWLADANDASGSQLGSQAALSDWLGWWWADPAAALVIGALTVKEGLELWEED